MAAPTPRYTWDGLPIAPEEPYGAAVVVRRPAACKTLEYLILHRAHRGRDYEGDWAWTPPSGSRQPGEPVLAAALRELAEETGLSAAAADLRALDLSGEWAAFALDVPSLSQAQLDAEHDGFEWLTAAEALTRCQPDAVADGIRLAESAMAAAIGFRPMAMADLPALVAWQHAPHAIRWFPERLDLAAAERKYGPRIASESPVRAHVMMADGRDVGFVQHYPVTAIDAEVADLSAAVGIDFAIGVPEFTGRGLGPQLIWSYVRDIALPAHPGCRHIVASPDIANARSIRALRKAGFVPADQIGLSGQRGPEQLCVLDRARFFGEPTRKAGCQ